MKRILLLSVISAALFSSCDKPVDDAEDDKLIYNELKYTTADEKVAELYSLSGFGAELVSNVYENGCGIITFDRNLKTIGASAFMMNSTLKTVAVPDKVTTVGASAFQLCYYLSEVELGGNVEIIKDNAFDGCWSLKSIKLPSTLKIIGKGAFQLSGLENVTIPEGVVEIGNGAFGTTLIRAVTIPNSVERVGNGAFQKCNILSSAQINNGVIEDYAFNECISLKTVTIGGGVKSIGQYAFCATSISKITIPESVESIGHAAFYQYYGSDKKMEVFCKRVTPPVAVKNNVDEWYPFGIPIPEDGLTIYVPNSAVDNYKKAAGWTIYASKIVGY